MPKWTLLNDVIDGDAFQIRNDAGTVLSIASDENVVRTNVVQFWQGPPPNESGIQVYFDGSENRLVFRGLNNGSVTGKHLTIDRDTGKVGLGVQQVSYQLELSQDRAGKPTSNTWTIASDRRLKKNIKTLEGALDRLLRLRGVTYQWIDPASEGNMDGTYCGLIAQEVEPVFPNWISTGPDGYKRLTVIGFEAVVVEAMGDMQADYRQLNDALDREIDRRDEVIAQQQETIDELSERLASVETAVARLAASDAGVPQ